MADTPPAPTPPPADETPNQRQARLRREKRNAKLASTGEERLAKIKQLNGGAAPPDEVLGGPATPLQTTKPNQPTNQPTHLNATVDDPEEVDISDHPYTPNNASGTGTPRSDGATQADPLMQAMMQMQAQQSGGQPPQPGGQQSGEQDPMAQMMQQMMGMMGGDPANPSAGPPGGGDPLQMLSTMMGGMGGGQKAAPSTSSAYLWRIVHALSALFIATYIALSSTFTGTELSRASAFNSTEAGVGPRLFWMFATTELVLQSTRYFMEKGQLQGSGWCAKIANSGFVPEPYAQYVRTVGRYSTIYSTVVSDAMVVVFVLGCLAWWRGAVEV